MKTQEFNEVAICEICNTAMHQKEAEIAHLDVNNLSLLSMFNIKTYYIVECLACRKSGLYIK